MTDLAALASVPRERLVRFGRMAAELRRREERKRQQGDGGLLAFVRYFWHVLEPETKFVEGWALEAVSRHLEAITSGEITRLLVNVPPGFMKSLLCDVFWPAWEWGPMGRPHLRYVAFSYAASLTERDNGKFRDLITSPQYRELWGNTFTPRKIGETKVTNNKTGFKLASSVGGVGTGERGDRIMLDDPHNVKESESEMVRSETVRWFRESMLNRLNDLEQSVIVVIMQRVHEEDVSGIILSAGMEYEHLCIPMEYDGRHCSTSIGWDDPRSQDGELAWEERFPVGVLETLRRDQGPYAYAGQYQQSPEPRGGGIIKRAWWQPWEKPTYPKFEFLLASLDTAYTIKQENDYSALVIWGVFRDIKGDPKAMLVRAWKARLELHQLVEKVAETCRFRNSNGAVVSIVDTLLIEAKASGLSAAQEIRRLHSSDGWGVRLIDPKGDKVARAYAVQHLFSDGVVYAPIERRWADDLITSCAQFPKGAHDDDVDAATQGLKWMRDNGLILRTSEHRAIVDNAMLYRSRNVEPLYPG